MSKGRKGRTPDQIRRDRAEIARLYLQRWTQADIGRKLGLSRQQVGYDLEAVRQEWLDSALTDFNARKAEELARIDRLELEYWAAWERSKADGAGDPRFLAGVERCIEQRAKILGLHAPTETRLTGKGGGPLVFSLEDAVAADRELEEAEGDPL
jgi:hypothetical protein